jgi:hypothetical protein
MRVTSLIEGKFEETFQLPEELKEQTFYAYKYEDKKQVKKDQEGWYLNVTPHSLKGVYVGIVKQAKLYIGWSSISPKERSFSKKEGIKIALERAIKAINEYKSYLIGNHPVFLYKGLHTPNRILNNLKPFVLGILNEVVYLKNKGLWKE